MIISQLVHRQLPPNENGQDGQENKQQGFVQQELSKSRILVGMYDGLIIFRYTVTELLTSHVKLIKITA
jgi:hypothetical protein